MSPKYISTQNLSIRPYLEVESLQTKVFKMRSHWTREGLQSKDWENPVMGKSWHRDTERPCGSRGRNWSDVAAIQGTPRMAGYPKKSEEARKDSSWSHQREHGSADTLTSTSSLWNWGRCVSVKPSHPVCGNFLWQLQEMDTGVLLSVSLFFGTKGRQHF